MNRSASSLGLTLASLDLARASRVLPMP
jgi:hypothetical protein